MRVRWSSNAANDLQRIVERIREDDPSAAQRVARTIHGAIAELRHFPYRGRKGQVPKTREIVFPPWPYIAVYEVDEQQGQLFVLRIRHASQHWP